MKTHYESRLFKENIMKTVISRATVVPFSDLPNQSIALDGYCSGGPALDLSRQSFNFDHHDGCLRLVTRATCQQVMDALTLGLEVAGKDVYINDVDGDTVLSVWLLRHPEAIEDQMIRELVESVGGIDAHGPAYRALDGGVAMAFYGTVMAAERALRRSREYESCNLEDLLDECGRALDLFVSAGCPPDEVPALPEFEVTHKGDNFVMATGQGFLFSGLYAAGHNRAVAYDELSEGKWRYTIGKKSDLVGGFPIGPGAKAGTLLHSLNELEKGWGGGSSIGGGPREGSKLSPDLVFKVIQDLLS